jgi:hypothetical protein
MPKRIRFLGDVALMEDKRNIYRGFLGKPEG